MKILIQLPPNWDQILNSGMRPDPQNTVFTVGDTIYNPSGREIPDHLIVHEEIHSEQQGDNPKGWWNRYITDPYFRVDQEVKAYATQYWFICKGLKDKNARYKVLYQLAESLSSVRYGAVVTRTAAMKLIKDKSKI